MNFFQLIYSDFRRYRTLKSNTFRTLFFTQGFTASWVFRLSNLVYEKIRFPIIRPILRLMTLFLLKGIEITTGIYLPEGCHVGPGLYIGHFGGIIINGESVIGSNCNLSHGVTLGSKNGGGNAGVPRLGNRV